MKNPSCRISRSLLVVLAACLVMPPAVQAVTLQSHTVKAWETYIQLTEKRISSELDGQKGFLLMDFKSPSDAAKIQNRLKKGEVHIERMRTRDAANREIDVEDGMIHHWFGAIFVPNVSLQRVLRFVQSYDDHYRYFKEVERSKLVSRNGDTFKIYYRFLRTKLSITVHYNTDHTAIYRLHDNTKASSRSFTTRIAEVDNVGTKDEKERPEGDDRGYLWRLNSYWRFKEADGGVWIECESISLSRSIPFPLGYVPGIKGIVESLPRESMGNTLVSIRDALSPRP